MRVIDYDRDLDTHTITGSYLCCECGVCDLYACPMNLSPRAIFREFKKRLAASGIKNPHSRNTLYSRESREYRKIPIGRLIRRLGLKDYDIDHKLDERDFHFHRVKIPLGQHIGVPSIPIVKQGEKVDRGQPVAEIPEGKLGSRIHASISGTVTSVDKGNVTIEAMEIRMEKT